MALLAEIDTLLGTLSCPATKKLMERAYQVFGDVRQTIEHMGDAMAALSNDWFRAA